jgi:hypothetical protein
MARGGRKFPYELRANGRDFAWLDEKGRQFDPISSGIGPIWCEKGAQNDLIRRFLEAKELSNTDGGAKGRSN